LEAMATGQPLIISCIPGVTDLANIDGQTGLFIQPGDTQGLKHAMLKLGELPDLRHKMGAAARQRIVEAFSWETYLKKWEEVYTHRPV
jgi:glycosyltransferase involved in cell wall biosynthesis